ncbi:hypothetical protein AMEX_G13075 [Astyanax mexicanus]|uniref:Uncharacterized protein n=1 Tax=Astyanax mexicanus TaxID=7994 RepID=A0A8T2LTI3_ASTMX|nr:hypothetical protein AMEX_G13075 [Astyanax mexicanus]
MKRTLSYEDPKKCRKKKKKLKKLKKEKLNKKKLRTKGQQWVKEDADCCESVSFTQMPEMKKKKKNIKLHEDCPLLVTQCKKSNVSKCHKQPKDNNHAMGAHKFKSPDEPTTPALEEKHQRSALGENVWHKKTVKFKLSPEEILNTSKQYPTFHTQPYLTDKSHTPITENSHNRPTFEEKSAEIQITPEYINSQDLFITQKFFSELHEDISRSPSTDEGVAVPPYQNNIKYRQASQETPSCKQTAEASVQTENFFTSPGLAGSLRFHHKSRASICTEEPIDLSLPKRTRQEVHLDQCISKPVEHQSCSELKITDLTSSDESDIPLKSRADLSHLKVIQTRLNESFFFRVKGEGESPKARSPLMMLTGSADKKLKK